MVDFFYTLGQSLCLVGLLYGAFLCISYRPDGDTGGRNARFDAVTTHAWDEHRARSLYRMPR